jgi:hypothetical protein
VNSGFVFVYFDRISDVEEFKNYLQDLINNPKDYNSIMNDKAYQIIKYWYVKPSPTPDDIIWATYG